MATHQTKQQAKQHSRQNGQQHAEQQLEQIGSDFNSTLPTIPEYKLQAAIKKGIDRGNKQKRLKHGFKKWGLPTGAVVLCALLFTLVSLQPIWTKLGNMTPETTNTSSSNDIPDKILQQLNTQALKNGEKYGLYQAIDQTFSDPQFIFTVHGIMTDGKSATIFYQMLLGKNVSFDSQSDVKFTDDNGKPLDVVMDPIIYEEGSKRIQNYEYKITFKLKSGQLPPTLIMNATPIVDGEVAENIKVKIPINTAAYTNLVKEIPIDKQIDSKSNSFKALKMILRPMSTELQLQISRADENLFHSFMQPKLITSDGKNYLPLEDLPSQNKDGILSYYFDSMYDKNIDTLYFQASGIEEQFAKQPKLVIDTVKKELVSSPDEFISLESITSYEANNTTEIELKINKKSYPDKYPFFVTKIKDANGVEYPINLRNYSLSVGSKDTEESQTLRIEIETKKYAQPLTLTLERYYNQQLQDIDASLLGEDSITIMPNK